MLRCIIWAHTQTFLWQFFCSVYSQPLVYLSHKKTRHQAHHVDIHVHPHTHVKACTTYSPTCACICIRCIKCRYDMYSQPVISIILADCNNPTCALLPFLQVCDVVCAVLAGLNCQPGRHALAVFVFSPTPVFLEFCTRLSQSVFVVPSVVPFLSTKAR